MQLTTSRIAEITADYFYADEERLIQCILAAGIDEDGLDALNAILDGAQKRGMDTAALVKKAFMRYEALQKLLGSERPQLIKSKLFHIPLRITR